MRNIELKTFFRDSMVIALVVGIVAGVLSTSISNALFSKAPNWEYVLTVVLLIALLVLARFSWTLYFSIKALASDIPDSHVAISKTEPPDRVSLGEALLKASTELVFFGISAKRSVTDDVFRRALEKIEDHEMRIRFLLLDPNSDEFAQRASDEGESVEAWSSDQAVTTSRLAAYRRDRNLKIELRYFDFYPVWRAIIVDREEVFVSVFLPGRRGTEASQYRMSKATEELAFGIINSYHTVWRRAREASL